MYSPAGRGSCVTSGAPRTTIEGTMQYHSLTCSGPKGTFIPATDGFGASLFGTCVTPRLD